ncbi:hypothetical protein [Meridianimarinicoccus aquatilis]|uniref:hypothetical protein n=1 Tax=Meridianimarinicoccus aquatilis TaxID=2552766 RepID=UPI001404EDCC|nr:hypothetical protein [Fluviibacterium aquatile]
MLAFDMADLCVDEGNVEKGRNGGMMVQVFCKFGDRDDPGFDAAPNGCTSS